MSQAGKFRWVAEIQAPPTAQKSTGELNTSVWRSLGTRRVAIREISGTKADDGTHQRQAIAWYGVTMRTNTALLASYRLVITGQPYDGKILYVNNVRHDLQETEATCVVRGNS